MILDQVAQSLLPFVSLNDLNEQECIYSKTYQSILSFSEDNNESFNKSNNNKLSDIWYNNYNNYSMNEDEMRMDISNKYFQDKFISIPTSNNWENDEKFNIMNQKNDSVYEKKEKTILQEKQSSNNFGNDERFNIIILENDSICRKNEMNEKTKGAKKRGRKRKRDNRKTHDKYDFDNLLTKIQIHFLKFVINLSNDALKTEFNKSCRHNFKQISHKLKRNVNYEYFISLKKSKIKDILQVNISKKYRNFEKDENKKTFDVVKQYQWLNKFFSIDYMKMFSDYYLKRLKSIEFEGKIINFSEKTKSFHDLLANNPTIRTQLIDILKCYN